MSQDFTLSMATNPEAWSAFASVYILGEEVERQDGAVAQNILIAWMRRAESAFLQYQEGLLDPSALKAYGIEDLVGWSDNPAFRRFWEQRRGSLHPDFVVYFEQLANEG